MSCVPRVPPCFEAIGKRIVEVRKRRGYTQADLADLMNTSQPAISRIESGRSPFAADFLLRLCQNMNCSPEYLLQDCLDPAPGFLRPQPGVGMTQEGRERDDSTKNRSRPEDRVPV